MAKAPIIIFCGGGSIGHLAPSMAIAQCAQEQAPCTPVFLCGMRADERTFVRTAGWRAHMIVAPKFPRGLTLRWIWFPLLFPVALLQSLLFLLFYRPHAVFSKGGYVSVPVCLVAFLLRVPIVLHESDAAVGLGNRLVGRLARRVCHGFPGAMAVGTKHVYTGNPVRGDIADGSRDEGLARTGFLGDRPVLLVIGGSQGAAAINALIARHAESLLDQADIVHLTGKGKAAAMENDLHYWSAPFVRDELKHLYALADLVITRAGAGVLSELALVAKPAIVIPLMGVAHDHQLKNANALALSSAAEILLQEEGDKLPHVVAELLADDARRKRLGEGLKRFFPADSAARIAALLLREAGDV